MMRQSSKGMRDSGTVAHRLLLLIMVEMRFPHRLDSAGRGRRTINESSTKQDIVAEFYGLPPIGQRQRRPMDGAQFHSPWVGEDCGRLI